MAKAGREVERKPRESPAPTADIAALPAELPAEPPARQKRARSPTSRPLPGLTQRLPPRDPDHPLHFERQSVRQLWADMYRLGAAANLVMVVQDMGGHFGLLGRKFHDNLLAVLTVFPGGDPVKDAGGVSSTNRGVRRTSVCL